jgi:hypothetical protein
LFSATNFAGVFTSFRLPALGPGLNWQNNLLLDGTIEVVNWNGPSFGRISAVGPALILSATNGVPGGNYAVLTATNLNSASSNWATVVSGSFDWLGTANLTLPINVSEPARFFRLRVP